MLWNNVISCEDYFIGLILAFSLNHYRLSSANAEWKSRPESVGGGWTLPECVRPGRSSVRRICAPECFDAVHSYHIVAPGRARSGPWASHGGSIQMHLESV